MLKVLKLLLQIAIDYYENIGDPKYKDYQFLIEDLLTQPTVLKHLNKESSEKVIKKHPLSKKVKLDVKVNLIRKTLKITCQKPIFDL